MNARIALITAAAALTGSVAFAASGPSDPQIAHIAYTAGALDVEVARLALEKSRNPAVREFAQTMVRDHEAENEKALELVKRLGVTPEPNATSEGLTKEAAATRAKLAKLNGKAFDQAYAANEAAYHATVNGALKSTLIPSADNRELKALLETGLTLFGEHQKHAEQLAARLKG